MQYTILSEITVYRDSFLFHIFPNSDTIYLNEAKTVIFVWIQNVGEEYRTLGLKNKIRVEILEDGLHIAGNAYDEIREILRQEILHFERYEFEPSDILMRV